MQREPLALFFLLPLIMQRIMQRISTSLLLYLWPTQRGKRERKTSRLLPHKWCGKGVKVWRWEWAELAAIWRVRFLKRSIERVREQAWEERVDRGRGGREAGEKQCLTQVVPS